MDEILGIIGRNKELFGRDLDAHEKEINEKINNSSFLIIGGSGSIGGATLKEIFKRSPRLLHVVDLSENSLAELVRTIRSSVGYIEGEFKTFCLDCGGEEFDAFLKAGGGYDYVLNFSAMKHVRSERDPFTLMRLIRVNVLNTEKTLRHAAAQGAEKYFCVSTDKATNPVNMMGASKCIMELFLMRASADLPVSTARFANVAFSSGSLLESFVKRVQQRQPIAAPSDVTRYFITPAESGVLCLLSTLVGKNRDIFFPKNTDELKLTTFTDIAVNYLESLGYTAHPCAGEDEARGRAAELIRQKKWPCYFFESDTTGEKPFEEFYTATDEVDWDRLVDIGVIKMKHDFSSEKLDFFQNRIQDLLGGQKWAKADLVDLFNDILDNFDHLEKNKYLDDKM